MVVTCPHCSKRYMLDEALLPEGGRQVRCIACHHVWWQITDIKLNKETPPFVGVPDATLQMSVSSERQSSWLGWILFFAVLFSCIITVIFGRNFIVSYWPKSEKYYELLGLQVSLPGSGLTISNASSQIHNDGPTDMIYITGSVINGSGRTRAIPPLKIKLVGDSGHQKCLEVDKDGVCILDQWEHRLSEQSLLPGEKIQFETDPHPKVDGAQHIRVEF